MKNSGLDEPGSDDAINDILGAVASQEKAIALFIRAEAEKLNLFIGDKGTFPASPSHEEMIELQRHVALILDGLLQQQRLLVRTLEICERLAKHHGGPL
ncbi:hypothetical protein SY83_16645 [Paenibacillus swuensis]|uniref:Uncharacterized protein n=2 Tax=Paenibacillus swuensis TaxID=1178515 RepID=A0A172TKY8_9BACL|nr:hypothetical protein SY83_16645 [Paenibacillus swuensis]